MRNRVSHEHFGVRLDRVWLVTRKDLPVLKRAVSAMLAAMDEF